MVNRPSFILSKGERRMMDEAVITCEDILYHYADVFATRFVWKKGPPRMPADFAERALFWTGGLGPVEIFGEEQIVPAVKALLGIYTEAVTWNPEPMEGSAYPPEIMRSQDATERPMLYTGSFAESIRPLCELMASAYRCLNTSIIGMQQPVVLQGAAGGEINAVEGDRAVNGYKPTVYALDKTGLQAQVLDLGGHDHTQNLIQTINALDCEILARMGIKSAGTEKASGITTEETLSINQELSLIIRRDYELRMQWLDKVKDRFPALQIEIAPELAIPEYAENGPGDGRQDNGTEEGSASAGGSDGREQPQTVAENRRSDGSSDGSVPQ